MALLFAGALGASPAITAIVNGASYTEGLSPGCWMVIFGSDLASTTQSASTLPLSENLGGASVTVGGFTSRLLYASPTQINALIPFEVPATGFNKVPVVLNNAGATASYDIYLNRNAPALFTRNASGSGRVLLFNSSFQLIDVPKEGDVITVYAAGLGFTNPPGKSDSGATVASPVVDEVEAFVGDQQAEVLYAGLAPGFPGIYQVNLRVSALWTDRLYLRQHGWISNVTNVGLEERNNVTDVTATIEPVLPSSAGGVAWSLPLFAATANVKFTLRPGAQPFVIAAVAGAGGSFTRVDTANGMLEEYWTAPTTLSDFSRLYATTTVMDFALGCQPFPNNMIPGARLDPTALNFVNYNLPPPRFPYPGFAAGSSVYPRGFDSGSSVYLNTQFGDFLQIPCGSQKTGKMTFAVYVDGKVVASKDIVYPIGGR